jgi:uncharacterized protein YdcH (DUF465 family)
MSVCSLSGLLLDLSSNRHILKRETQMNITLRKASALQNSIQEAVRSIKIKTSIEINEFQNTEAEIQKAKSELAKNDERRQRLILALYNIRGLVGAANAQCGINLSLAKAAFIDKRIVQLEEISGADPMTALDVVVGKLDKIRNRPADSRASLYGRDDVVAVSIVSQEQINQAKTEIQTLKKQKQKINDEVLELNIKTEVPLADDVVATLTAEGLI